MTYVNQNNNSITVLMAVRNGASFLRTSIDSILSQTFKDFSFLIVDDASTDDTIPLIESYSDSRIEILRLPRNLGQTGALNFGLNHVSANWIARMDADDYSAPTRLAEQFKAVAQNHQVSCFGTFAWTFRDDPMVVDSVMERKLNHDEIKKDLLRGAPIIHGSILVKTSALRDVGGYNAKFRYSADIELYDRFFEKYLGQNIPLQLLGVRRHEQQGSLTVIAFDEVIEIFNSRLVSLKYSNDESREIKKSLSKFYITRAFMRAKGIEIAALVSDLKSAVFTSPSTVGFVLPTVIVSVFFPETWKVMIRKLKRSIC